jgi:hypothetical protein
MTSFGGTETKYDVVVRNKDGVQIYREKTIEKNYPPKPPVPDCPDCLEDYKIALSQWKEECDRLTDYYIKLTEYHRLRCDYCMENRNNGIDIKYITGEPQPKISEVDEAIKELRELGG